MDPNRFFGHHIDALSLGGKAVALLLALVLSGMIGLERQLRGQPAGLRTHILVGVGSALLSLTSVEFGVGGAGGHGDPARLAAQVVSGIGFLGAGAILRDGLSVHGLTTAASIWVVAAIGIAIGGGPRLGEVAVVAALIVLATLVVLNWLEDALHLKQRVQVVRLEVIEAEHGPARVLALFAEKGLHVEGMTSEVGSPTDAQPTRRMQVRVRLPRTIDRQRLLALFATESVIRSFDIE